MLNDKGYLVYDGVLYPADAPILKTINRSFRFGDGLFETIRYHKGEPLFFADHYERLLRGMAVMRMNTLGFPSRNEFRERIISLINKNRFFSDVRIRVTIFRKGEGLYTPESNNVSWLIETTPLNDKGYYLNEKGLVVGIFNEFPKHSSPISPFKTASSVPYILAGIYCKEQQFDDCLVVNGYGKIIESVSANLFWIKGQTVYTPGIGSGCIEGIIRKQIMQLLPELDFYVLETPGATITELNDAEEVFLTNSISGIRWVMGLNETRFFGIRIRDIFRRFAKSAEIN